MKNKILKIFPFLFLGLILFLPEAKADISFSSSGGANTATTTAQEGGTYSAIQAYLPLGYNCAPPDPAGVWVHISVNGTTYETAQYGYSASCPANQFSVATTTFYFSSPVPISGGDSISAQFRVQNNGGQYAGVYTTQNFTLFKDTGSDLSQEILYPENSTSTYIHDFSHFTIKATNRDNHFHIFTLQLIYDTTSTFTSSPVALQLPASFYQFGANTTHYLAFSKYQYLSTSTTYFAKICSFEDANINQVCTTPIQFNIGSNPYGYQLNTSQAGWFGSTTTESGIMVNQILSSTTQVSNPGLICDTAFYNPANWVCWAYKGVTGAIDDLGRIAGLGVQRIVSTTQVVFPINIIYDFNMDLNAVTATTSDVNITLTGQGTAWKKPGGGYYSFTLLNTSTIKQAENGTAFDWETLAVYFLYAITGLAMLAIAIVLLHNSSKPPNA